MCAKEEKRSEGGVREVLGGKECWSFTISPSLSLPVFASLSPTGSGNTVDISPTWLPDTASAPFQFHPSFLPFSLFPPPTLSSLAGVKEKQKLAPDHVEVIGIKLH